MKTSQKIKKWARIGQIAFWLCMYFGVGFERQLPMHEATVYSGTIEEAFLAIVTLAFAVLFSEAVVRIVCYFAELLEVT